MHAVFDQLQSMYEPSYMTTLTEWNYAVVSSHTEFKLRMLVVFDIACVIKCPLLGKTGFCDNKAIYL